MGYNINIVSDIFNKASELFDGNEKKVSKWMNTSNTNFGGSSPLSACKPYDGAVKVEEYLDRKLQEKKNIQTNTK